MVDEKQFPPNTYPISHGVQETAYAEQSETIGGDTGLDRDEEGYFHSIPIEKDAPRDDHDGASYLMQIKDLWEESGTGENK